MMCWFSDVIPPTGPGSTSPGEESATMPDDLLTSVENHVTSPKTMASPVHCLPIQPKPVTETVETGKTSQVTETRESVENWGSEREDGKTTEKTGAKMEGEFGGEGKSCSNWQSMSV